MKIGLTHTGNAQKHQYYIDWLKANEDITVVELSADKNNLYELDNCDGLVLSGGVDVHPKYYTNNNLSYPGAPSTFNVERDEFEIAAFNSAQQNNKPVLGICRGLQLINVINKGTLIQNLGDDTFNKVHKGEPDKSHKAIVKPGTLLYDIIESQETEVNSAHHQAIENLGDGLIINAISADGLVEGIERADKAIGPFLLAVQWHPERMFRFQLENSPASKAIRNRFIEEIKKSLANKDEDN
jgi:putative glutamine amidotransferase